MYAPFFGLKKEPFGMTPDPSFLFLTVQHRETLAGMSYALLTSKGFVVITGEAGTGKTTLLTRTLQSLPKERIQFSMILNPTLTPSEFLESVLLDFGFRDVPASKAQRLTKLQQFLLEGERAGKISALVVDEAHKLSVDLLEEIRLLGNFERTDKKLLQIVLAGQSELDRTLEREDLWQLKQRVALRLSLRPLAKQEIEQYIRHRWVKAGGVDSPFSAEAVALVARFSRGIPRVVNAICDNALMLAFAEGASSVGPVQVQAAAKDLRIGSAADPKPTAEPKPLVPAPPSMAVLSTLERYGPAPRPSRLSRWAGRLGFAPRTETI